jgi:hypothetical protein
MITLRFGGGAGSVGVGSAAMGNRGFEVRFRLTARTSFRWIDASGLGESRYRFGFDISLIGRGERMVEVMGVELDCIVYNAKTAGYGKAAITCHHVKLLLTLKGLFWR